MKHYIEHTADGCILSAGSCQDEVIAFKQANTSHIILELPEPLASPADYYVVGDVLYSIPPKPTRFHTFDYATNAYVFSKEDAWVSVKRRRNQLLLASDWTVTSDRLTEEKRALWKAYRDFLFDDITNQPDPTNISWPVKPD